MSRRALAGVFVSLAVSSTALAGGVCPCLGDLNGNGVVGAEDLATMLGAWGNCSNCASCAADLSGDCVVSAIDLGILLGNWGPCSPIPANDHCADAIEIVSWTGSANPFCTFGADTDGPTSTCGVPAITGIDGDVWYRFTSPMDGVVQVGVCADFPVRIAVYGQNLLGSCSCPGGLFGPPLVGCAGTESFPYCGQGAALLVPAEAGECFTLRVGGAPGERGSGNIDLNFFLPPCTIPSSTTLAAAGLEAGTEFGLCADISDDVGIAGAIFDDLIFGGQSAGSARAYRYVGNTWTPEQTILPPESFAGQRFGITVAASGNRIAVGAGDVDAACVADPDCDTGQVFVYEFDGNDWVFDQSLLPLSGDGSPADHFGSRVDIDGTRTIVGAREDDNANGTRAGAAYVYELFPIFGTTIWLQTAKLEAGDGDNFDEFGSDVAVSGTWALVGADNDEGGGSAYLFEDTAGGWTQTAKLHVAGLPNTASFGYAVAIDGPIAVVAAPDFLGGPGKVFIYERFDANGWLLTATLTAHDGAVGNSFGASVSIAGNQLLVGAPGDTGNRGAAYLFWRVPGGWVERAKLGAGSPVAGDSFGGAVAIENGRGLVGAYFDDIGLSFDVGSVYRFHGLFECTGNGVPDACDIANGVPDSDNDGVPDICEP